MVSPIPKHKHITFCASGWIDPCCSFKPAPSWSFISLCPAPWVEKKLPWRHMMPCLTSQRYVTVLAMKQRNFITITSIWSVCWILSVCQLFSSILLSLFKKIVKKKKEIEFHCFPVSSEKPWAKLGSLAAWDGAVHQGSWMPSSSLLASLLPLRSCWLEHHSNFFHALRCPEPFFSKRHIWVQINIYRLC